MLGFMPGFPYLGGLDEQLHTPRRNQPRLKIHAGSVGMRIIKQDYIHQILLADGKLLDAHR